CWASATSEVVADGENADADGFARAEIYDCHSGDGLQVGANEAIESLLDEDLDELFAGGCAAESTEIVQALGDNTNAYAAGDAIIRNCYGNCHATAFTSAVAEGEGCNAIAINDSAVTAFCGAC